jgi:hypothetical protein
MQLTNSGEDVEMLDLAILLLGMQNGTDTLKKTLAVSHKSKYTFTI